MTKAERIFQNTRFECKKHIETWGYESNSGFTGLIYKENESISQRTINRIRQILKSKKDGLRLDEKLGILSPEKRERESQILDMVEKTLNNSEKALNDWKNW